jgi:cobalt-precorrin 5A hydrolase
MAGDEAMIAIGIGCRRGAARDAIIALICRARQAAGLEQGAAELFSLDRKAGEAGLIAAADLLGLPLRFLPAPDLAALDSLIVTRSARSEEETGIASVAEAAALAGAGPGARLVLPRIAADGVTCAIAFGEIE